MLRLILRAHEATASGIDIRFFFHPKGFLDLSPVAKRFLEFIIEHLVVMNDVEVPGPVVLLFQVKHCLMGEPDDMEASDEFLVAHWVRAMIQGSRCGEDVASAEVQQ